MRNNRKNEQNTVGIAPINLLLPLLSPYKGRLAGGILAMAVSSLMMLALGWGLKNIVDNGFASPESRHFLNHALLVLLGVIVIMALASYIRLKLVNEVAERVIADLRKKIFSHFLSLDAAYFEQNKTADQVSRLNADTTVLQMVITSNLPSTFRHLLMLTGGVVMLFVVSPGMTAVTLLVVPLVIAPIIFFGRRVRRKSRETQSRIGDMGAYSQEILQGLQTIQSFGYEESARAIFSGLSDETFRTALNYIRVRAVLTSFVIATVFGAIGVVLWTGGHKVLDGEMTAGDLSAFIFYAATVAGAVTAISEAMSDFSRAGGAADRIFSVLQAQPVLKGALLDEAALGTVAGHIAFENVSFCYPARPDQSALNQVSFEITAGESVALVGPSGAGKTTIFQLLQRFYDPQSGIIGIDGMDITSCNPREIRRHLGVVAQDPAILSTTIADNIRMGRPDATDADVRYVAELAQAHEFIMALPQQYETIVGERGSRLSGGQKQRLAIARALLKNPKILLLDEATSALDAANELAVHQALKNLMRGRTTLIIAHRLSTVQGVDRIIVLDKGQVVAQGTHAQLFGKDALYTHLAGLQMEARTG